ncbi:MAG TPA: tetratricopeptide repeat protein [Pyrinomonadaceae bacterium]|nr:tetratricopeptide repeat protein [Pyrinomonadaceae bacterium]
MKARLVVILALIATVAITAAAQTNSESTKRLVWELGSNISLSGALHAQGASKPLVDRRFAAARKAATSLGLTIPDLPPVAGDRVKDSALMLQYILARTGNPIGDILQKNLGTEHVAIFEIALKSNILLIMYGPGESTTTTIANVIRTRRERTNLPNAMTDKLLQLIAAQAPYDDVKAELLNVHEFAPPFIAVLEYNENGEKFYAAKDYAASAASFTRAITIDPTGPEYYFGRARAYMQLNKHNEAVADYTKVIALKGSSASVARNLPLVYHNRGLAYGLTSRGALAIADLTNAIKLKPDYASAFKVRGLIYRQMGNAKLASSDLEKAESLQPGITK